MRELDIVRFMCPACGERVDVVDVVRLHDGVATDSTMPTVSDKDFLGIDGSDELVSLTGLSSHLKLCLAGLVGFTPAGLGSLRLLGV